MTRTCPVLLIYCFLLLFISIAFACPQRTFASTTASIPSKESVEMTELWTGSLFTSTYTVAVCTKNDGSLRGVVLLKSVSGQVDVYHIYGSVEHGQIQARHASGHSFRGNYASPSKVEGTIRLKNGYKLSLHAKRQLNVPVSDDCAPIVR